MSKFLDFISNQTKKMNKIVLLFSFLLTIIQSNAIAQTPRTPVDFIKRIPVHQWIDDNQFKVYKMEANQRGNYFAVNVLTGVETPFAQPTPRKALFSTKRNGDIAIPTLDGKGADTLKNTKNPQLSPDSTHLAYTKNNNLYVFNLKEHKEIQITKDGSETIYNGWSSWVYNEEILGRGMANRAFWWSPDSKRIVFMRFDDSQVPVYYMSDESELHQKQIPVRYPLPGDRNPQVKIGIADVSTTAITWTTHDEKNDQYFGEPIWTPNSNLWVQWMNRNQDSLKVQAIDLKTGNYQTIYTENQKTWVSLDQENRITFIPGNKSFIVMSDKDGWMHLYLHQMDGKLIKQLTSGNWKVKEIKYIDSKANQIYFIANKENSTRDDLYKVSLTSGKLIRLTFGNFQHRISLSPNAKYFTTEYSNYNTPSRLAVLDNNGKLIRELDNSKGKEYDKYLPLVRKSEIIRVKTPDGFELPVRITWPVKIDSTKKYPLIANIYGGPNSSMVSDGYFTDYNPSEEDAELIRIQMDHRGSGHFGKIGQNYMYRNLGKWEIEDYSTVIRYLEQKYPFIDATRIGIMGFSYGGYISALALTKAPDVFTVGLAGGSVTDWHFYDSVYTERYMDKPSDNPDGYKSSSVLTYVNQLKGHLSLAQGMLDDNVHLRNTVKLVDALIEADKKFEVMYYPGAAHGWYFMKHKALHYNEANQSFIKKYLLKN